MATPKESTSGDNHGNEYQEADPEDVNPYQPEDSPDEQGSEIEDSEEGNRSYEPEESPEDSSRERSSASATSENEINTYGLQERYRTSMTKLVATQAIITKRTYMRSESLHVNHQNTI